MTPPHFSAAVYKMMIGYFEVMWHEEHKSASLTLPTQAPKL
jgi:hypothetical protein